MKIKYGTEKELTTAIRSRLNLLNIFHWKQWQGPMSQPRGVSDILGIVPKHISEHAGKMLAIEVKTERGRVTPYQQAFIDKVNENGGLAFVARSIDDVIEKLGVQDRFLFR